MDFIQEGLIEDSIASDPPALERAVNDFRIDAHMENKTAYQKAVRGDDFNEEYLRRTSDLGFKVALIELFKELTDEVKQLRQIIGSRE